MDVGCNRSNIESPLMRALVDPSDPSKDVHFDMHVQVTVGNFMHVGCMPLYVDDPRYLIIMHHAEEGNLHTLLANFRNSYVASGGEGVAKLTQRHFLPSLMPIEATPPNCGAPPVFIVQGGLERRNLTSMKLLFDMVQKT
jgi:hypothetical protein